MSLPSLLHPLYLHEEHEHFLDATQATPWPQQYPRQRCAKFADSSVIEEVMIDVCRADRHPSFQEAIQAWQAKHDDAALLAVTDRLVAEHQREAAIASNQKVTPASRISYEEANF